jgi:hypothetical protein
MIALNVDKADGFISKLQRKGVKVRWDGWTMVFFKTNPYARTVVKSNTGERAVYNNGEWGFETRISADEKGSWLIPYRLAKGPNA